MIDNNTRTLQTANRHVRTAGIFSILAGIAFVGFAFVAQRDMGGSFLPSFLGMIGILSLVAGIIRFSKAQAYPVPDQGSSPGDG